jgi:hypothetical protein
MAIQDRPAPRVEQALAYLSNFAWSVIPVCAPGRNGRCLYHQACTDPGKVPLIKWGPYQARLPEPDEIREWWHKWPEANIALVTGETSDVVIVDIDGDMAQAEASRRGYDSGPWVATGRIGGVHRYFRWRHDAPTIFAKTSGLDFRGDGGYALLPPSRHVSGVIYSWGDPVRRGDPLPALPRWVNEIATMGRSGVARLPVDMESMFLKGIPEGQRDQELFRAAAKLRGIDVPYEIALGVIENAAAGCSPPFPRELARAKVASAYLRYVPNTIEEVVLTPVQALVMASAAELVMMDLPEPRWVVPGIIPEGVCLLCGKSKLGKSWLALDIALAVAEGGLVWGNIEVQQGDVLYLALEDSWRRLQDRLRMLRRNEAPPGLYLRTNVPRADEGGVQAVLEWLDQHPNARLVVVDMLGKFRPKDTGKTRQLYDLDYQSIEPIVAVARMRGIGVLVLHHANKLNPEDPVDSVSGTTGLVGAVDAILIMRRERGKHDASLFVTGRDVEQQDLGFRSQLGLPDITTAWQLVGDAAEIRMGQVTREYIDAINQQPGMSAAELAAVTGRSVPATRQRLFHMSHDGLVRNMDARFYPALNTTPVPRNIPTAHPPITPVTPSTPSTPSTRDTPDAQASFLISNSGTDGTCRACGGELGPAEAASRYQLHFDCVMPGGVA